VLLAPQAGEPTLLSRSWKQEQKLNQHCSAVLEFEGSNWLCDRRIS